MLGMLGQYRTFLVVIAGFMLFSNTGYSQEIFVVPEGKGIGNGSKNRPYTSIERALEKVSSLRKSGKKQPVTISLRGGVYRISRTLKFDSSLSDVVIRAYKEEKVSFSGGIEIPTAAVRPANLPPRYRPVENNIMEVNLKEVGITDYGEIHNVGFSRPYVPAWGEVFINGKPLHLSRWPDAGMIPMGKVLDRGSVPRYKDFTGRGGVIQYDSSRIAGWSDETDAWMSGYFMWGYADNMVKIREIDTINKTITTATPEMYGYGYGKSLNRWYGVNILRELDSPDEFYIDREKGVLYFIPSVETIESLVFSMLEVPFIFLGHTENVSIRGITFEYGRDMGIAMDNTTGVVIQGCTFRNLGSLGVTIGKGVEIMDEYYISGTGTPKSGIVGSLQEHIYDNTTFYREGGRNNRILDCEFYHLGAGGVILGGGNKVTLEPGNNVVENCLFHDLTRIEKTYRPPVYLTGCGNKVLHCEMYDAPNMAIYMHGNNHLIAYNYIHDVCLEVDDQGAIYYGRDPSDRGTMIYANYIANIPIRFSTRGVYEDDGTCGLSVIGNVFYKAGTYNVFIGGGSDNMTKNNIFIDNSKVGIYVDNRMENWLNPFIKEDGLFRKRLNAVNYLSPPYITQYPTLKNYLDNAGLPTGNLIENNVFVRINTPLNGSQDWMDYRDNNWITYRDPGFMDWENGNFLLKDNSAVYEKLPGFEKIPFDKIGRYKDPGGRSR